MIESEDFDEDAEFVVEESKQYARSPYQKTKPTNKRMSTSLSESESEDEGGPLEGDGAVVHVVACHDIADGEYCHFAVLTIDGTSLGTHFDEDVVRLMNLIKKGGKKFKLDSLKRHMPDPYYTEFKKSQNDYLVSNCANSVQEVEAWIQELQKHVSTTNNSDLISKMKKSVVIGHVQLE